MIELRPSPFPIQLLDAILAKQISDIERAIAKVDLDIYSWGADIRLLDYQLQSGLPDPRTGKPTWPDAWVDGIVKQIQHKQGKIRNGLLEKKSLEADRNFWKGVRSGHTTSSAASSQGGGTVVAQTQGEGTVVAQTSNASNGSGSYSSGNQTNRGDVDNARGDSTSSGGSGEPFTYPTEGGYVTVTPSTPDPTREPSGLTGNQLVDQAILSNAHFQAGFIALRQGPSHALRPEGAEDPGRGSVDVSTLDPNFDPLAPYVKPGEGYEGPRFHPPRRYTSGPLKRQYVEALDPDGEPMAPYNESLPVIDPHAPPPDEGGDPHAVVVSYSAGVRSLTVNLVSGRVARSSRRGR